MERMEEMKVHNESNEPKRSNKQKKLNKQKGSKKLNQWNERKKSNGWLFSKEANAMIISLKKDGYTYSGICKKINEINVQNGIIKKKYTPKQIRQRWVNNLDPQNYRGPLSEKEKAFIIEWAGNSKELDDIIHWKDLISIMEKEFGVSRSENQLKNHWYSSQRTAGRTEFAKPPSIQISTISFPLPSSATAFKSPPIQISTISFPAETAFKSPLIQTPTISFPLPNSATAFKSPPIQIPTISFPAETAFKTPPIQTPTIPFPPPSAATDLSPFKSFPIQKPISSPNPFKSHLMISIPSLKLPPIQNPTINSPNPFKPHVMLSIPALRLAPIQNPTVV